MTMKAQTPDSHPAADTQRLPGGLPADGSSAEWLSALADGDAPATDTAVQAAVADAAARQRWSDYHLIGEALRSPRSTGRSRTPDDAFLARVRAGMAAAGNTDAVTNERSRVQGAPTRAPRQAEPAANDAVFRWRMVAGVAVVTAIGALTTVLTGAPSAPDARLAGQPAAEGVQAAVRVVPPASADAQPAAAVAASAMLRDPRLDAFLQAHRDAGGPSALHMPTGFLRNATFEGPAR